MSDAAIAQYLHWATQYILFHGKHHPQDLSEDHVQRFLAHMVGSRNADPDWPATAYRPLSPRFMAAVLQSTRLWQASRRSPTKTWCARSCATEQQPRPLEEINHDISSGMSKVVARMLAKSPNDRYQSPGEVSEALKDVLAKLSQP